MSKALSGSIDNNKNVDFTNHWEQSKPSKSSHTISVNRADANENNAKDMDLPISVQNQLLQDWNPLSAFQNTRLTNCTIDISINVSPQKNLFPKHKRRRIFIEEDSEE